ncbi:hypothetical protein PS943_05665 [Pseudomonas fluorescens]|uniref:Uncharacterized protein n=1 Tax=Pseudomonas fluorescens TaxID=294 RepID=A0A5E7WTJ3_PSEFL|nr:hypothetical protein PS943_05665 [Pseudomonas fluorescens]
MTRSFSHYTDGVGVYLTSKLKIFFGSWEMWCLICRHREQARLPQGLKLTHIFVINTYPCGSRACSGRRSDDEASSLSAK